MPTYRGVVVVTHDGLIPVHELIQHLAERTMLHVEGDEIESLQVVILWRSLVDVESDD